MTPQTLNAHAADEVAVRDLYEQLMDAWNKGSGEAYAAPFAEDGDLIGFDEKHFRERQEVVPFHVDRWHNRSIGLDNAPAAMLYQALPTADGLRRLGAKRTKCN
jgi:hypothetical protein